jgi:nicotinamidase-related amidase
MPSRDRPDRTFSKGAASMKALVIVDMLEDFVDGALANQRAQAIVAPLYRLLAHARADGWVVVFSNDAHLPGDPELEVWGEHAMAGTSGAQVVAELQPRPGEREIVSPKRAYGAFDGTGLDEQLRSRGVDEVVLAGQHTHICVRHSAYGALIRGYHIIVPRDAVCAFEGVDEEEALEYLRSVYGARVTTVADLTGAVPVKAGDERPLGGEYESGDVLTHEP